MSKIKIINIITIFHKFGIMADVHNKATRSYNMSQIKGKNTKPEIRVRKFLFANGFRYRLHVKKLPGKPDIVLPKYRTVIFVHGCFWHGHEDCEYYVIPKTRSAWWMKKIDSNKTRDDKVRRELANLSWNVIEIWECRIKDMDLDKILVNLKL